MIRRAPSAASQPSAGGQPAAGGQPPAIVGERGAPLVARALSRQARLSNRLATALMVLLGVTVLVWYYGRQLGRQSHLRQARQLAASAEAGTEMALPPLGDFLVPPAAQSTRVQPAGLSISSNTPVTAESLSAQTPALPAAAPSPTMATVALGPVLPVAPLAASAASSRGVIDSGPPRAQGVGERRLQGDVYAALPAETGGFVPAGTVPVSVPAPAAAGAGQRELLAAPDSVPVAARRLRGRSLLLSKGTFIDCTLETAIDSTLPGITSCVTASDTYSADGRVVLLERGTRLFGETQGQVQQGSARVYVLWTEARTPAGVVVPLESPGTDELGRAGLPGTVQRHFWERFGAAILLSTIDGAVQAAVQASSRDSGTVIYNPGATQDVMTEVLKSTVAIPPTVIKRNGDRIEILVARDVDFASVYALRPAQAGE